MKSFASSISLILAFVALSSCSTLSSRSGGSGELIQRGVASWYGQRFQGRKTASGELFDMHKLTAAHRTLPFGTIVHVKSTSNGKSVRVRINDRGPFAHNRVIDLSYEAANRLGIVSKGHDEVEIYGDAASPGRGLATTH